MPSMDSFNSAMPDPVALLVLFGGGGEEEEAEGGGSRLRTTVGGSGSTAPVPASLSCCAVIRDGTKVMERPPALSWTSSTPGTRDSRARASCRVAWGPGPLVVGSSSVSVGTGVAELLASGRLDSKPMSSTAAARDCGLCRPGSKRTVALFSSNDTYNNNNNDDDIQSHSCDQMYIYITFMMRIEQVSIIDNSKVNRMSFIIAKLPA